MYSVRGTTALLLSGLNDYEISFVVGLLQENDIEVFVDTKQGLLAQYEVFVFNRDLRRAKQLLGDSKKVFETIENPFQRAPRGRDKLILRILLLLTSLFFGVISYYAFLSSENIMALIIIGISVSFLAILVFSIERGGKGGRPESAG